MMLSGIMGQSRRKDQPRLPRCAPAHSLKEREDDPKSIGPEVPEAGSSMSVDVTDLRAFYASPLGSVTRRLVGRGIDRFWGPLTGAARPRPRLRDALSRAPCGRGRAGWPSCRPSQGVVNWPRTGRPPRRWSIRMMIPLPDASIDRILLVHALETGGGPERAAARDLADPHARRAAHRWSRPTGAASGRAWTRRPSARASPSAARSSTA